MPAGSPSTPAPAPASPVEEKDFEDARVEDPNTEGTRFQAALGERASPRRLRFFSRLDSELADAVHKDAETVEFSEAEEKAVKRRIDRRVLSLVIGSYLFNQFDRTNIGNVHTVAAFNETYGVTNNNRWTLALSVFYIGYCLLEMPANVLQRRIGANKFFFMSLSWWGLASLSFVYAKSYTGLLILRVILGIGEAGYYAGMVYYLSFWYKRSELAMRISICMTGTYPGAISGLIAFGLLRVQTPVLKGWQFLFLIEAIPTIIMALLLLLFLPSFPFTASFLTPRQKAIAQARLNRDQKPTSHGGMSAFRAFTAVVFDVNAWLLVVIYCGFNIGTATITYFLPTLIVELGFSGIDAQGMTVAPYVAGWFLVVLQAWHSDRTRDRGWHVVASTFVAFLGYLILATSVQKSVGAGYFALFLVVGGNFSLFPLVMSWAANCFSPTPKRGVGTAFSCPSRTAFPCESRSVSHCFAVCVRAEAPWRRAQRCPADLLRQLRRLPQGACHLRRVSLRVDARGVHPPHAARAQEPQKPGAPPGDDPGREGGLDGRARDRGYGSAVCVHGVKDVYELEVTISRLMHCTLEYVSRSS